MRNLEAKFRLFDHAKARRQAEAIGFVHHTAFNQDDTFFAVPHGKLKLREEAAGAWLIHYRRDHSGALELSDYSIAPIADAATTRTMLAAALGVIARVHKRRTLLLRDQIRLHLDEVDQLGAFGEIEAVLGEGKAAGVYHASVQELLDVLEVPASALIGVSYFEMIQQAARLR